MGERGGKPRNNETGPPLYPENIFQQVDNQGKSSVGILT
jgi:hypothetical protein